PFLLLHFLVVVRVAGIEAGYVDFNIGFRCVGLGCVIRDIGAELFELRIDRHVHLLERDGDLAFGGLGLESGGCEHRQGQGKAGEGEPACGFACEHGNPFGMSGQGSMRCSVRSLSMNWGLATASTCTTNTPSSSMFNQYCTG